MLRRVLLIAAALLLAASPGICQREELPDQSAGDHQALPPGHPPIDGRGGPAQPMGRPGGVAGGVLDQLTPENLEEFEGKIAAMGLAISPSPGEEMAPSGALMIALETGEGTRQVLLGPAWYLYQQEPRLRLGDEVKVMGWTVTVEGESFVVAQSVTKEGQTITLRDENGLPKWAGGRMRRGGMMERGGGCPMRDMEEGQGGMGPQPEAPGML